MSILNFHCKTAREVPLKELGGRQDLDPLSWQENFSANYIYIYIYIYTKFIVWCEGKERSIPLQVERKQSKHTRQRSDVATLSFTPVGDLQATGSSRL